ncbi:unnamed protein product [Protopolystoma xenopodis]|uniref:Uncharacterized protein n=1 Tax=Protopolystoma xenopodis TaxID=117903 RepID=A0A448X8E6_9PLAT|nr:unnamed protein product [Protopolystoma xenopodis]
MNGRIEASTSIHDSCCCWILPEPLGSSQSRNPYRTNSPGQPFLEMTITTLIVSTLRQICVMAKLVGLSRSPSVETQASLPTTLSLSSSLQDFTWQTLAKSTLLGPFSKEPRVSDLRL